MANDKDKTVLYQLTGGATQASLLDGTEVLNVEQQGLKKVTKVSDINTYVQSKAVADVNDFGSTGIKTDKIAESTTGKTITLANLLSPSVGNGVAATGTSQGTATLLTKQLNFITGADGTKGITMMVGQPGTFVLIHNDNSGILNVWPNTGMKIDGGSANAAITMAANEKRLFYQASATTGWESCQFLSNTWAVNTSGTFLPSADNTYDIGNHSVNPRDIEVSRNIITDNVVEHNTDAGVTIETLLLKDGNLTMPEAGNVVAGTTTGTKIGTVGGASGQKLAFWNATPIVQPLLETGAAHSADDIITFLQTLGLCRQS